MNAANIITLARLLSVPLTVALIAGGAWTAAFALFVVAALSDAVDGFLAKRFDMRTRLGGFLDPLADKAMLVSVYVTLGAQDQLPVWLVILVVSRDVLIVGAVLLAFAMDIELPIQPLYVSKANTVAQIVLAAAALANLGPLPTPAWFRALLVFLVAATTLVSGAAYVVQWARGQSRTNGSRPA